MLAQLTGVLVFGLFNNLTCGDESYNQRIRKAVNRSIQVVEKSAQEYLSHRECFSCHHQAMPIIALETARRKGYQVDKKKLGAQVEHTFQHFKKNVAKYRDGRGTGGQVDTAGYGLWALHAGGWAKDEHTGAVVDYLLKRDREKKFWRRSGERPPSEASNFTATFVATRALKAYGNADQKEAIREKLEKVSKWTLQEKTKETEDLVFKLNLLVELDPSSEKVKLVAKSLREEQNLDGGWSQMQSLQSDAYATATSLYALLKSGTMEASDPRCQQAINYLLDRQKEDGSWFVSSRSNPFQEYFESGFPHREDQFISITATCWAMIVLAEMAAGP